MSDLYPIGTPPPDRATERPCGICGGPTQTRSVVFMPKAEVMICQGCANDLYKSLAPKAETIPVSNPVKKSVTRKATMPFDVKKMAEDAKAEVYLRLLQLGLQH